MPAHQEVVTFENKLSASARRLKEVIRNRLPLSEEGTRDVVKLIKSCTVNELCLLGLQPPPAPAVSHALTALPLQDRLHEVQVLISSLQYNHSSTYFYNVSKQRPLPAILSTAAGILRDPLPIKCIEAVFLGLLLTQGWEQGSLQRIPVGFKSAAADGQMYRHIVLAIVDTSTCCFGGLGMSRRDNLMYKPLMFRSLYELVQDYMYAYSYWGHDVVKVRVGLPVEHDTAYTGPVCWRYCTINPKKHTRDRVAATLNNHAAAAAKLQERFKTAAMTSHNSPNSCSGLTPRPHATKPYAGGSGPLDHDGSCQASPRTTILKSSRHSLGESHRTPATAPCSGGCSSPKVTAGQCSTVSSCRSCGSDIHLTAGSVASMTAGSSSLRHSVDRSRSQPPVGCATGHTMTTPHGAAVEDDADSSSDEVDADVSVCTFDSDSEINLVVEAIRAESPPCSRRAAHAS